MDNEEFFPDYDDDVEIQDDYVQPEVADADLNLHQLGDDPAQVNLLDQAIVPPVIAS